jgi:hypothetical protein
MYDQMFCTSCGSLGEPIYQNKGSLTTVLVLFVAFVIGLFIDLILGTLLLFVFLGYWILVL